MYNLLWMHSLELTESHQPYPRRNPFLKYFDLHLSHLWIASGVIKHGLLENHPFSLFYFQPSMMIYDQSRTNYLHHDKTPTFPMVYSHAPILIMHFARGLPWIFNVGWHQRVHLSQAPIFLALALPSSSNSNSITTEFNKTSPGHGPNGPLHGKDA